MERNESLKMEEVFGNSSLLANSFPLQSIFDFSSEGDKFPLGFMELLASPPLFDISQQVPSLVTEPPLKIESPEGFNLPATPKSSSVSSASSEAVNDEPGKVDDLKDEQQKTEKQLKPKKTKQKRQREPRFAFMTRSEVDHLEDGYRWRKYGQKAVKNSTFPRGYYRCTSTSCNVKKRVERSFTDPSMVVTTYEGQHNHPSPLMSRPSLGGSHLNSGVAAGAAFGMPMQRDESDFYHHQLQQLPFSSTLSPLNFNAGLLKDHGLLQDIIPSLTRGVDEMI